MKMIVHFRYGSVGWDVENREEGLKLQEYLQTFGSTCGVEFIDDEPIPCEICPSCGQRILPKYEIDFSHRKSTIF